MSPLPANGIFHGFFLDGDVFQRFSSTGEGWIVWMPAWLRHQGPVYFLNGGLGAWQKAEHPLTTDTRGFMTEWLPGHLPDAVYIPWEKFYKGKDRTTLSSEDLKALLKKNGVDPTKPIVYYCSGGIRSGYTWLVHELSGLPSAVNFEGGTEEWKKTRPLVR